MLIKCPECELQVSDKALSCPHCGYPMQPNAKPRKPRNKNNKRRRLPNGFGQISEIKNRNLRNPFRAMVTVGKTESGKPICKPLKPNAYFPTYNDAYAALVEYNRNPYDLEPAITVRELYKKWSEEYFKLKSENYARAMRSAWGYCTSVYDMRVKDVRARHIKGCMEEGTITKRGVVSHPSVHVKNNIKTVFNLMLDYALEYELVDRNYARSFTFTDDAAEQPSGTKKAHIPFSEQEMDLLWKRVNDIRGIDIILIQCYSGWRPQELGTIELANVDLEKGTFMGGLKTAAGKDRIVPIHSRITPLVEQRYQEAVNLGSNYLFNYSNQNRYTKSIKLTYDRYAYIFEQIRDGLKLNPAHRPHDGRKHFVTMAKKYNVDEYAIKYMVGHRISDITEKVYTQRDVEWLIQEIEKIK